MAKIMRPKRRVYVLWVQRHHPPPPSLVIAHGHVNPDQLHKDAAEIVNDERRRLGLPQSATAGNWSALLVEMRKTHDLWVDVAVSAVDVVMTERVD